MWFFLQYLSLNIYNLYYVFDYSKQGKISCGLYHNTGCILWSVWMVPFEDEMLLATSEVRTHLLISFRFVAICYPLKVRSLINGCRARLSIGSILLLCVIVNLPRFWNEAIDTMDCAGGWSVYFRSMGYIRRNTRLLYISVYFLVATVLPFLILLFCNIRLVRALRKSLGFRLPVKGVSSASQADTHRITLTLVVIVVMYMILVLPVEVSNFVRDTVIYTPSMTQSYNLLLAFLNTMQVSNFAFHFVLYCVVNVHFRHSMKTIFVCERERRSTRLALTEYDQAIALTHNGDATGATVF